MLAAFLGFLGSLISFVLWLPQAKKVWRVRKDPHALRGVSLGTQYIVIANALVWFAYAYVLGEFWVGAAGFINLPLAIFTIILIRNAERKVIGEVLLNCPACGYHDMTPHMFFVTDPPGWGTVYPCPRDVKYRLPRGVGVLQENVRSLRVSLRS